MSGSYDIKERECLSELKKFEYDINFLERAIDQLERYNAYVPSEMNETNVAIKNLKGTKNMLINCYDKLKSIKDEIIPLQK